MESNAHVKSHSLRLAQNVETPIESGAMFALPVRIKPKAPTCSVAAQLIKPLSALKIVSNNMTIYVVYIYIAMYIYIYLIYTVYVCMLIMTNLIMTFAIHAIFYSSHHDSSSCIHMYIYI